MFLIEAHTRNDRLNSVHVIEELISACGGVIIDFHQFSNISLNLNCEIVADVISGLVESMTLSGFVVTKHTQRTSTGSDQGFIVITFVHQEPDLRIVVPAVPG